MGTMYRWGRNPRTSVVHSSSFSRSLAYRYGCCSSCGDASSFLKVSCSSCPSFVLFLKAFFQVQEGVTHEACTVLKAISNEVNLSSKSYILHSRKMHIHVKRQIFHVFWRKILFLCCVYFSHENGKFGKSLDSFETALTVYRARVSLQLRRTGAHSFLHLHGTLWARTQVPLRIWLCNWLQYLKNSMLHYTAQLTRC